MKKWVHIPECTFILYIKEYMILCLMEYAHKQKKIDQSIPSQVTNARMQEHLHTQRMIMHT